MASKKKEKPLKGNGKDGRDYAEFIRDLLDGSVRATKLLDTTSPDGTQDVTLEKFDAQGEPLPPVTITVSKRKLTKLEYDDPDG